MNYDATRLDTAALRALLRSLIGLAEGQVLPGDQPGPPPDGLHLVLREQASREVGVSRCLFLPAGERERVITSCETTFRLYGFGTGALELLRDVRSLLQSSRACDGLRGLRAALLRLSLLENHSTVKDGVALEQAWIDLVIGHEHRVDVDQKRIATAVIQARSSVGLDAATTVTQTET